MKKPLLLYKDLSRLPVGSHLRAAGARAGQYTTLQLFEPGAVWQWITSYLKYAFRRRHPFLDASAAPNGASLYHVPNALRISVAGDWGTGTAEAEAVAQQMMTWTDGAPVDFTIHLGDVYYVGDEPEVEENCFGKQNGPINGVTWPSGTRGSFALNGNHEMYANGNAYFDLFLPALGIKRTDGAPGRQGPSFFCLENDYWRMIGIDTGYNSVGLPIISLWLEGDCHLPDPLIDWLRATVRPKDHPKATIILSHHQYFSGFEGNYPKPAEQLAEFFDSPLIWLWGHEHRLAGYRYFGTDKLKVHGRCIGHGGMPIAVKSPSTKLADQVLFYDARINPKYQEDKLGYNGFIGLDLADDLLKITYYSLASSGAGYSASPTPLLEEEFRAKGSDITALPLKVLCKDQNFIVT